MPIYKGSCHCGDVRFEVTKAEPIDRLIDCNCSICAKKGILHCPVRVEEFRLLSDEGAVALYQFGSGDARHQFCPRCGIHVYGRPRNHPERYTVNARCLDEYESVLANVTVVSFNGQDHPKDHEA